MPEFHISVLGSGSSGNSTFVSDGSVKLLLDAGLTCRELERRLKTLGVAPSHIDAVILSHEHSDHAKGAWRFCAKHDVRLVATEGTYRALKPLPDKPVAWMRARTRSSVKLGRLTIDLFPTPHDAADPVGFRLRRGKLAFGHVTDLGHISDDVVNGLRGCSAILIEANHDVEMLRESDYPASLRHRVGSRFGHLSNDALASYLERRLPDGVRHIFLAHLSQQNNHERLALECCLAALERRGGRAPKLHLTYAGRPTPLLRLSEPRMALDDHKQGVLVFA